MTSSCPTFIYCTFIIIVNIVITKETLLRPEDTKLEKGLDLKLKYLFGLMKYVAVSIYINTSILQCIGHLDYGLT